MKLKAYFFVALTIIFCKFTYAKDPLTEGFSYLEKGDYSRAFSTFSSISAENPQVLTAKGMAKYFLKDYKKSIYYLEKSLKFESEKKNWIPNFFTGLVYYELKDFSKAIYYFNIAYTIKPSLETSLWLGKTLLEHGNYIEAEKFLLEALKEDKQNEEIYEKLLSIYLQFENFDKINEILQIARNVNFNSPILDFYEAKVYIKKGDIEKAKKILKSLPKDRFQKEIESLLGTLSISDNKKVGFFKRFGSPFKIESKDKKLKIYSVLIIISLIAIGLFYRRRKKDIEQKLDFASELMKMNDLNGCEEILDSIRATYTEKYKILKIKLLTLKNRFFEALDLCDELNDIKTKEILKAYIYLFNSDMLNFQKHIDYVEMTLDKETAEELANLKYHDIYTLKKLFINLYVG